MPDPNRKILSASQLAGVWNQSPYCTRWMLYQWMANDVAIDDEDNIRIRMGRLMEPVILKLTEDEVGLTVVPHREQLFVTRTNGTGLTLGATRDANVFDRDLGYGVVEAKNVDWLVWKNDWTDEMAPTHIELQLQAQMWVGDGEKPYGWGIIAALVGGNDLKLYRRVPNLKLWQEMEAAAREFYAEVEARQEPKAFGTVREIECLKELYPEQEPGEVKSVDDEELTFLAENYLDATRQASKANKAKTMAKARLLAAAGSAQILNVPGFEVTVKDRQRAACEVKASSWKEIKLREVS